MMRIKIVVEECDFPPTETLLRLLQAGIVQSAPSDVEVQLTHQPIPEGTLPAFTERLRCASNQAAVLMHADTTLDFAVYIVIAQTMFQDPASGSTAFSRNALIAGVRSHSGIEWNMLEVIGGGSLPERARTQVVQTHQRFIAERGMDQQHATEEEIAIAETLMGLARASITPLLGQLLQGSGRA